MRQPLPGDYLVIRTHGLMAQGIRFGCAIGGTWSPYNHAAIYVGPVDHVPSIVEANPSGVCVTDLSTYAPEDVIVSRRALSPWERAKITTAARALVGTPYGWLDIAALAAVQLRHCPRWLEDRAKRDDRLVCSQVVTTAYAAAGLTVIPGKDPWAVTPGDLAQQALVDLDA